MTKIMVDNWFMEEVVSDIKGKKINQSDYYERLLMAIVLWDEVYYPKNKYNYWNAISSEVKNALLPLDDDNESGKEEAIKRLYDYKKIPIDEYYRLKCKEPFLFRREDAINCGAIRYLMLSSSNGLDYLPCDERREFLFKYLNENTIRTYLSRMNLQNNLTKTIEEYYVESYKMLADFTNLKIKMPILSKYIFENTPESMTPVDFAFHLKNEGQVVKYRKYLDEIENALETQDWKELRYLNRCSEDAVNSVLLLDKKRLKGITVRILPTPSIMFNTSNVAAGLSLSPSFSINNFEKLFRKFNLTFIKDITKYAIDDMHI